MNPFVNYLSFALAVCGLFLQVIEILERRKRGAGKSARLADRLILVVILVLVVSTGFAVYESIAHARRVSITSAAIERALESGLKTNEELAEAVNARDADILGESLAKLIAEKRVGQKILTLRDDEGRRLRTRGFYLIEQNVPPARQ
jgi:hypothetical protein